MIPVKNRTYCGRFPWMTLILGILNILVFGYELLLDRAQLESFFRVFGVVPAQLLGLHPDSHSGISNHVLLPLLTSQFIHGDFFHILMNMWTLYLFAPCVEDRLGHFRFAIFYLLSGIGASLFHAVLNAGSMIPTIGASGAIAGVLGAYFVLLPFSRIVVLFPVFFLPLFFEIPAFFYLFLWFISQLHSGTWAMVSDQANHAGIAFWAHIGGFLTGIYLLSVFAPRKRKHLRA